MSAHLAWIYIQVGVYKVDLLPECMCRVLMLVVGP